MIRFLEICRNYIITSWPSVQTRYAKPESETQERASRREVD